MTADNPDARVDLDALRLTEDEREAVVLAFIEGWMSEVDEDDAEYLRTDDTTREAGVLYAEVVTPAVERILADRLAPLLAERDEARAERDYWQRQAEGFLRAATDDLGRYHRLRERMESLAWSFDQGDTSDQRVAFALLAALANPEAS